jgi:hypothetical protein
MYVNRPNLEMLNLNVLWHGVECGPEHLFRSRDIETLEQKGNELIQKEWSVEELKRRIDWRWCGGQYVIDSYYEMQARAPQVEEDFDW